MKAERKQLSDELKAETEALEQVKAERRGLEADLLKMKLNRDTNTRKIKYVVSNTKPDARKSYHIHMLRIFNS